MFLLIMQIALPQRLPIVNSDLNNWGTILNNYLRVSHGLNGSIDASTDAVFQQGINIGNGFLTLDAGTGITNISTLNVKNNIDIGNGFLITNGITGITNISTLNIRNNLNIANGFLTTNGITGITNISALNIANNLNIANGFLTTNGITGITNISALNVKNDINIGNGRLIVNGTSGVTSISNLIATFSSLTIDDNINSSVTASITNNNDGSDAIAQLSLFNDLGSTVGCLITSSNHAIFPDIGLCSSDAANGFILEAESTAPVILTSDGTDILIAQNNKVTIDNTLNVTGSEVYFPTLIKCSDLVTPCANNDTVRIIMPGGQLCCT